MYPRWWNIRQIHIFRHIYKRYSDFWSLPVCPSRIKCSLLRDRTITRHHDTRATTINTGLIAEWNALQHASPNHDANFDSVILAAALLIRHVSSQGFLFKKSLLLNPAPGDPQHCVVSGPPGFSTYYWAHQPCIMSWIRCTGAGKRETVQCCVLPEAGFRNTSLRKQNRKKKNEQLQML